MLLKLRKWVWCSGWIKYYLDGCIEEVDVFDENMLCFDIEVMWKESFFVVMVCVLSLIVWYVWLFLWFLGEFENDW